MARIRMDAKRRPDSACGTNVGPMRDVGYAGPAPIAPSGGRANPVMRKLIRRAGNA
jgi:hypothetical protein